MTPDELKKKKWGVMAHFIPRLQNNPEHVANEGVGYGSWNDIVAHVDVANIANSLHQIGAKYFLFTMMQGDRFMNAPNQTYNDITGYKTGEACTERDLIEDLYFALNRFDIDLIVYFTGDGPWSDKQAGKRMGFYDRSMPVSERFVKNQAAVLSEYAARYKTKASGWWIDGCYYYFGYNERFYTYYADAVFKENKNGLLAFNRGVTYNTEVLKGIRQLPERRSALDNYTAGEVNSLGLLPPSDRIDGKQWHELSPLGLDGGDGGWGNRGVKYDTQWLSEYAANVFDRGGVVTMDIALSRSGRFDEEQMKAIEKSFCRF